MFWPTPAISGDTLMRGPWWRCSPGQRWPVFRLSPLVYIPPEARTRFAKWSSLWRPAAPSSCRARPRRRPQRNDHDGHQSLRDGLALLRLPRVEKEPPPTSAARSASAPASPAPRVVKAAPTVDDVDCSTTCSWGHGEVGEERHVREASRRLRQGETRRSLGRG